MTKNIPSRQCIGCHESKNKNELIRIVKNDDGISIDFTGRKNGRGAYICNSTECLTKAVRSKGLDRAFKTAVDKEVYDSLVKQLENQL